MKAIYLWFKFFEPQKGAFLGRGAKCVWRKYAFRPQMHGVPPPNPSFFLNWVCFSVIFLINVFECMSKIPTQRLLTSRQSIAGALVLRIVCSTRIMDFLWKGKWSGVEISDSKNRLLDRRECDNRRCQKKDLATCVLRHLQVVKPYIITSRGIVESNTIARSATNPSALIPAWRCTPLFMPGRNHTSVQSVTSRLDRKAFWVDTPSFTVEKKIHTWTWYLRLLNFQFTPMCKLYWTKMNRVFA